MAKYQCPDCGAGDDHMNDALDSEGNCATDSLGNEILECDVCGNENYAVDCYQKERDAALADMAEFDGKHILKEERD